MQITYIALVGDEIAEKLAAGPGAWQHPGYGLVQRVGNITDEWGPATTGCDLIAGGLRNPPVGVEPADNDGWHLVSRHVRPATYAPATLLVAGVEYPVSILRDDCAVYLLWSVEHHQWWAAGGRGYTSDLTQAGRYPFAEAFRHASEPGALDEVDVAVAEDATHFSPLGAIIRMP
jgi:hypothetical protein